MGGEYHHERASSRGKSGRRAGENAIRVTVMETKLAIIFLVVSQLLVLLVHIIVTVSARRAKKSGQRTSL